MINLKKSAALLIAASLFAVSMAGCAAKTETSSSSETSSVASSEASSSSEVTSSDASSSSEVTSSDAASSDVTSSTTSAGTTSASSVKPTSSVKTSSVVSHPVVKPTNETSGAVKNMNGRTVIFDIFNDVDNGPTDKHVERMQAKIAAVSKQYNCNIKITHAEGSGNTGVVKNSVIAGKPVVDLWELQWAPWLASYVAGLIQPIDSLKCIDFSQAKYQLPTTLPMVVNGVHYGVNISRNGLSSAFQFDQMMFYRSDVLKKSGVTANMMPDVLAKNGQWTWANFEAICKKVNAAGNKSLTDYAGSGGMNQINLYQDICYTYGTDFVAQDAKTKTVTFNGGSATALKALDYYVSLVKNKIIQAPDCTKTNPSDMCSDDTLAFSPEICCMAKWLYPRWGTQISKDNWCMTYLPKVKASDAYTVTSMALVGGWTIPYGVAHPADAATVLNAITFLDEDYTAGKKETMMDYTQWVNTNYADSILWVENQINDLAYTSGQQYEVTEFAVGPGIAKDWLTHVQKIPTGQEDAASVIKANAGKYNSQLKDLYVVR